MKFTSTLALGLLFAVPALVHGAVQVQGNLTHNGVTTNIQLTTECNQTIPLDNNVFMTVVQDETGAYSFKVDVATMGQDDMPCVVSKSIPAVWNEPTAMSFDDMELCVTAQVYELEVAHTECAQGIVEQI